MKAETDEWEEIVIKDETWSSNNLLAFAKNEEVRNCWNIDSVYL